MENIPAGAETRPFVVLDGVSGPGGWRSKATAAKFAAGHWAAPAHLPAAPPNYRGYAVVPAADALTVLRTAAGKGSAEKGAAPLKVSVVRLATAPVAADPGGVRLPVWRVTFDAATGTFRIPAVASPARYDAGDAVSAGPAAAAAWGGRTLTLGSAGEAATCAAAKVAGVDRVLLGVDEDGPCAARSR